MNSERRLYPSQTERRHSKSLEAKRIATRGEDLAANFLTTNSYKLLARNYRAGREGEIDIIALDPNSVVTFVEVKTRSIDGPIFGIPEIGFEAVGYRKQKKILVASHKFISQSEFAGKRWRYDVIVVWVPPDPEAEAEIIHVADAFK